MLDEGQNKRIRSDGLVDSIQLINLLIRKLILIINIMLNRLFKLESNYPYTVRSPY